MSTNINLPEILSSIDTEYKLIAFISVLLVIVIIHRFSRKERLIEKIFKRDRAELLRSEFDSDNIKSDDLSKDHRFKLKSESIKNRKDNKRRSQYLVAAVILLSLAIFSITYVYNNKNTVEISPRNIVLPVVTSESHGVECPEPLLETSPLECLFKERK